MRLFLEFFIFELKFRFKTISTYVYFAIWFAFSFLCIASENFGPIAAGNGKVLLNGPYANIYNDVFSTFFGLIIIGAIFGTSILRDFQRDTTQILFTKPISKFGYLGGRWAGSFLATVFAFSGLVFGELLGTLAPWADHTRIAPTHLWWYLQPFLSTRAGSDLLHRLHLLYGGGSYPSHLYRLRAGCCLSDSVPDRSRCIFGNSCYRPLLARRL